MVEDDDPTGLGNRSSGKQQEHCDEDDPRATTDLFTVSDHAASPGSAHARIIRKDG